MRGHVDRQENMWFTMRTEDFIPENHPLREIKKLADAELARLAPVFSKAYAKSGRRSVPPERLGNRRAETDAICGAVEDKALRRGICCCLQHASINQDQT